jgi:hypothetical protein
LDRLVLVFPAIPAFKDQLDLAEPTEHPVDLDLQE